LDDSFGVRFCSLIALNLQLAFWHLSFDVYPCDLFTLIEVVYFAITSPSIRMCQLRQVDLRFFLPRTDLLAALDD
jgi:uncharacterized membrane protein